MSDPKSLRFFIDGITCTGCVEDIERLLIEEDGISSASVNYADGVIDIEYDPRIINEETISTIIKRLGLKINAIQSS
ncbi:MAG: heavy metal-associated domain-containing protein [Candidatus Nitrosotenuis sp.]